MRLSENYFQILTFSLCHTQVHRTEDQRNLFTLFFKTRETSLSKSVKHKTRNENSILVLILKVRYNIYLYSYIFNYIMSWYIFQRNRSIHQNK
jgi:hypothetical protein